MNDTKQKALEALKTQVEGELEAINAERGKLEYQLLLRTTFMQALNNELAMLATSDEGRE